MHPGLKHYLCDNGLHQHYGEQLFYYSRGIEVDFYIPSKDVAIQASYNVDDHDTLHRKVSALVALHSYKPLSRALIVTTTGKTQSSAKTLQ